MVEFRFENNDLTLTSPANDFAKTGEGLHDLRFARLLGTQAWKALPAAVKARFSKRTPQGHSHVYTGYTVTTQMNFAGRTLAQLLRIVGSPLPLHRDNANCAAVVTVTDDVDGGGQVWSRQYCGAQGFPQIIQSAKRFAGPTGLEEYITRNIGMSLEVSVKDEALIFSGIRYFAKMFGHRIYIPGPLTPGRLTVTHADHGDGWFEFGLDLEHKLFGQLLHQRIMFEDSPKAALCDDAVPR